MPICIDKFRFPIYNIKDFEVMHLAGFFEIFTRELYVALISMLPVVELRGAIPVGIGMGLNIFAVYIIAVLGNCIPVPIILWLARPAVKWLKSTKLLRPCAEMIERKTNKNRDKIMKYSAFGLFVFVAIPLPGTGAWSGAIAAALLDMRFRYALPSIVGGVMMAGLIMCFGTSAVQWIINLF